jgi:hypothetical protein
MTVQVIGLLHENSLKITTPGATATCCQVCPEFVVTSSSPEEGFCA